MEHRMARNIPGNDVNLRDFCGPHPRGARREHDQDVIQMNDVYHCASAWVQRAARNVISMIDEPGDSDRRPRRSPQNEETTMLKTISAALLAVSVLAAPVMAASPDKTAQAPATKSAQVKPNALNAKQAKPNALNANAKMGRHHRHYSHHRSHKKMTALKTHQVSKATIKHVTPATKRG